MSTAANPKANQSHPSNAPQEPTGAITSDSLAAESIKAGGEFAQNDNAAISSVKGANSTLNTTDTSGARVLPAAKDGTERAREEAKGLGSDEKGVTGAKYPETIGQPEFSGTHSQEGYVGGASATGTSSTSDKLPSGATGDSFADGGAGLTGSSSTTDSKVSSGSAAKDTTSASSSASAPAQGTGARATGGGSGTSADTAPNYAATVSGALRPEGEDKPKGENLTEGGIPQTKTFVGDVGGQHDPGRLATKEFTKVGPGNAASAGETGGAQGDSGPAITGGQYDVLESERA